MKSKYPTREMGFMFGNWCIIHSAKGGYVCRCACGKIQFICRGNLERGKTRSCVLCANRRIHAELGSVYDKFGQYPREIIDRLANRYYAVVSRCRGKGGAAHRYGKRGITCEFANVYEFVEYALSLPGYDNPKLQLDRENNNGNYARGNLRFVPPKVNNRNKVTNRHIVWDGRTMASVEFWERYCPRYIDQGTVARKIRKGVPPAQIIAEQANCRGAYAS